MAFPQNSRGSYSNYLVSGKEKQEKLIFSSFCFAFFLLYREMGEMKEWGMFTAVLSTFFPTSLCALVGVGPKKAQKIFTRLSFASCFLSLNLWLLWPHPQEYGSAHIWPELYLQRELWKNPEEMVGEPRGHNSLFPMSPYFSFFLWELADPQNLLRNPGSFRVIVIETSKISSNIASPPIAYLGGYIFMIKIFPRRKEKTEMKGIHTLIPPHHVSLGTKPGFHLAILIFPLFGTLHRGNVVERVEAGVSSALCARALVRFPKFSQLYSSVTPSSNLCWQELSIFQCLKRALLDSKINTGCGGTVPT